MLALSPEQAVDLADEAFNRGDIDGMLAFYEEEAVMPFEPGRAIRGRLALRAALQPLMTAKLIAKHEAKYVIEAGDIALRIASARCEQQGIRTERLTRLSWLSGMTLDRLPLAPRIACFEYHWYEHPGVGKVELKRKQVNRR